MSKNTSGKIRFWIPVAAGKLCPCCGRRTVRVSSSWIVRPLRMLLPFKTSSRACQHCYWNGFSFHR